MISAVEAQRNALRNLLDPSIVAIAEAEILAAVANGLGSTTIVLRVTKSLGSSNAMMVCKWLEAWGYEVSIQGPVDPDVSVREIHTNRDAYIPIIYQVSWVMGKYRGILGG